MTIYRAAACNDADLTDGASWSESEDVVRRRFLPQRETNCRRAAVHSTVIVPDGVLGRFARPNEPDHGELEVVVDPTLLKNVHCLPPFKTGGTGAIRRIGRGPSSTFAPCC
jgi:hypothetical protein